MVRFGKFAKRAANEPVKRRFLRVPSPATVIAMIALLVATAGTAWGVQTVRHYPEFNGVDIIDNSLTGQDVKNGSLGKADLNTSFVRNLRGPAGQNGTNGVNGQNGAPGPPGAPGANAFGTLTYKFATGTVAANSTVGADALCPSGLHPTGGGVAVEDPQVEGVAASYPSVDSNGNFVSYTAYVYNASSSLSHTFTVVVVCAAGNQATKAANAPLRAGLR